LAEEHVETQDEACHGLKPWHALKPVVGAANAHGYVNTNNGEGFYTCNLSEIVLQMHPQTEDE
jgi:hypothetical protein